MTTRALAELAENKKFFTVEFSKTSEKLTKYLFKNTRVSVDFRTNNLGSKVLKTPDNRSSGANKKPSVYKLKCGGMTPFT